MLKVYKNLRWLKLTQALEYIELLTDTKLPAEVLYQFGRERQIPVYVDLSLPGIRGKLSDTKEEIEVTGVQQVLNPDIAFTDAEQTCAVLSHGDAHWIGLLPRTKRAVILKREDVEVLATRLNSSALIENGETETESSEPTKEIAVAPSLNSGLTFPYATTELKAMRSVAIKYWANYNPSLRQPTQYEIGLDLGDMLNLKRLKNGDPARKAMELAKAIKPDNLPDT